LAATNQQLDVLIERGRFRKDLYYRLRGVTIHLPPLRDRREDIAELAHYFLFRHNRQLGAAAQSISQEAMALLEAYDWPGNVRELQSVIREALIVSAGPTIRAEFLPPELHEKRASLPDADIEADSVPDVDQGALAEFVSTAIAGGETDVYRRALEHFDRLVISSALRQTNGQQNRAAEILGLSRATLRTKLRNMQLSVERVLAPRPSESQRE
jgi:two-component system nitrogen regulation response regulator GlnG